MATNKIKCLFFAFVFLAISAQLFAQEEPRLTQRFSWSGGEYALRYEVIFEQMVNNNYVSHSRRFITERFIEVSLTIGDYRFRIIPYDILDKPAAASEWKYFKIIPVPPKTEQREPEAPKELEFVPHYEEEKIDEPEPEPEPLPVFEPEPEPQPEPEPVLADEPEPEQKEIEAEKTAEAEPLQEIKNPYALKSVIFSAGMFASLHFSIYGKELKEDIFPFNFGARFNVTFKLPLEIYIGPEITANFYRFTVADEYNMFFLAPGINILVSKWLPNERAAFGLRFGAMYLHYTYKAFDLENLIANSGALFKLRITPVFLLEAGFDYFHIINVKPGGYIRPWLGIGFQL